MNSIEVKAPAKINIHLTITGVREDGYHLLRMVMVPLSLYDIIRVEEISSGIEVICDKPDIPTDKTNLVWKAANSIINKFGIQRGVKINIKKHIPAGGGLGGGSSDAGAVLNALNSLWNLNLSFEDLATMGVKFGADIPFFCQKRPAICEGIGEIIQPIEINTDLNIILINPGIHISTPWAYQEWDRLNLQSAATIDNKRDYQLTEKSKGVSFPPLFEDLQSIVEILHNDFEEPVIKKYPEIKKAKDVLIGLGAVSSMMTGSGSTVFGIFENCGQRDKAAEELKKRSWKFFSVNNIN